MKLHLTYDAGDGQWVAQVDQDNGTPAYDGSGDSVEKALADLVGSLMRALEVKS